MAKAPKCPNCKGTISLTFGKCMSDDCPSNAKSVARKPSRAEQLAAALGDAEHMIKRGWMLIGQTLAEIKEGKHYIELGFSDFGALCESRGYTLRRGNQFIEAAAKGADLGKILPDLPDSEAAVRALSEVQRDDGDDAVREVAADAGPKPTEKKIRDTAKKRKASKEQAEQPQLEPTYAIEPACTHVFECIHCGAHPSAGRGN